MGKNDNNFLIGAIVGGVIGAATALFLAPKSGRELRDDINTQASVVRDKTERWRNEAVDKGSELANVAKEKTSNFTKNVNNQSSQIFDKVKEFANAPIDDKQLVQQSEELVDEIVGLTSSNDGTDADEIRRRLEEADKALTLAESQSNTQPNPQS
ncbi:YtxH domain-containing protein [Bacillus luteolus]|uniref:YtxH domain-containing protein n=1 Tax=Litchfieldia luteola TaxID=682179 RepID=A0ABR9QIH3_9BACI|nr:YtxH domain-containing protein [Cytobacillus luteolus]MBE4908302.1 YtxH domain-containing protein [Cytobacillus luteolus]MBP1943088.1 gas vesicle protein [Cytobacillus luteolus]